MSAREVTQAEMDAMPVGAVVLDRDGDAWQKRVTFAGTDWVAAAHPWVLGDSDLLTKRGPLTALEAAAAVRGDERDAEAPDGVDGHPCVRVEAYLALKAERDDLRRWKAEAAEVILGLQDLGRALGIPLGERITGPKAAEIARALEAERDDLRKRLDEVREVHVKRVVRVPTFDEFDSPWATGCACGSNFWPCETVRILDTPTPDVSRLHESIAELEEGQG